MATKNYSIRVVIDATGAKQGGREVESALDGVGRRA